jgi:CHAT domain-containing protein
MDEQRVQAYLALIQELLDCPSEEENDILNQSIELVDEEFVQVCELVAAQLQEAGQDNQAQFLRDVAQEVGPYLNSQTSAVATGEGQVQGTEEDYLNFLIEVLGAIEQSQGNSQVVYPLLQQNLDKLDFKIIYFLRLLLSHKLLDLEDDEAFYIAADVGNFATLITQFPLGSRAENLEIGIACYEIISTILNYQKFPQDWATVQNNLGTAYVDRIRGDRAENIEQSISYYQSALKVFKPKTFPEDWAMIQNNLGNAYSYRIRGERADNLEQAIDFYKSTLKVYVRELFPYKWATTYNNLGFAYNLRIRGDRAENIEQAISFYKLALDVTNRNAYLQDWAGTQNNLGIAYLNRILGKRADNIEVAISTIKTSLEVLNFQENPEKWANAHIVVGEAYRNRIKGQQSDNQEQAIAAFQSALSVCTQKAFPEKWATIQNNLGLVYSDYINDKQLDNQERAITAFQSALSVFTRKALPYLWAVTQNNLGRVYSQRLKGEQLDNQQISISCYQAALEVHTVNAYPQDHTKTLYNLGLVYRDQYCYYTHDIEKKQTALENAYSTFDQALNTVELLRGEITSGDEARRKLNEQWNKLYLCMVEVCLELGRYTDAIEYVDRSKARNLTELIATRDAYPGGEIADEDRQRLQQLRQAISEEDRRLKQDPNPDYAHISQLRQEFQAKYPYKPLKFPDIQSLLDDETVILEWYVLDDKFLTFTLTKHSLNLWTSSEEDRQNLIDWTVAYIDDYIDNKTQWQNNLPQRLEQLAQILHLDEILANLRKNFPKCQKLILIPHRFLHLFPLHALPVTTEDGESKFLQDLFPKGVGYAPNCQVLQQAQKRINQRPDFNQLFAIQNPTEDLHFTDMEVEAIESLFNPHQVLKHDQAEKAAIDKETLKNAHCTHFSCHGYFNFEDALKSALILAKSEFTPPPPTDDPSRYLPLEDNQLLDLAKCLTLEDILRLDLSHCRLVTLSACETGITDITSTSDEYIGLPSGFIFAGSPNVVSTLWSVADISTAILMIHFYQTLQKQPDLSVVLALQHSQKWLRSATVQDLLNWIDSCPAISQERREEMEDMLGWYPLDFKRFESPYYWAAFCAIGQ